MFEEFSIKKISVIGLGYVGMPLAIEFSNYYDVIGFDVNKEKINAYLNGIDETNEVGDDAVSESTVDFTCDENKLKEANFHIIAVPTPINANKTPDLNPIINASITLGQNLTKGSIVVYESTVYPGLTEEICIPILEKFSGLRYKIDFKVGYSPERINPGDKINKLTTIVKIVSGCDDISLDIIAKVYEKIIKPGVFRAKSIKVAEASKILENSQRDINIAFINEISIMFKLMDIKIDDVLEGCKTKWNFLNFEPGLVGGNCIGVDPYYLIYKSNELGYNPKIMTTSRDVNDNMGTYIGEKIIRSVINCDKKVKGCKVGIFGVTFKENCPDCSNSKVIDIINYLKCYGVDVKVFDPIAKEKDVYYQFKIDLSSLEDMNNLDVIVFAVKHDIFNELFDLNIIKTMYTSEDYILFDIKGIYNNFDMLKDFIYWKL